MNDPDNTVGIVPDYDTPVEAIYTVAASSILKASGNLDLLGICSTNQLDESTHNLPSWVPRLVHSWRRLLASTIFATQQISKFTASGDTKPSPRFPDSTTLLLSGHLFDTVAEVGDLFRVEDGAAWDHLDSDDDEPTEEDDPDPTADPDSASAQHRDTETTRHDAPGRTSAASETTAPLKTTRASPPNTTVPPKMATQRPPGKPRSFQIRERD